jgi:hypothetical protein
MDSTSGPISEINVGSIVSAVQWSRTEPGRLVVAAGSAVHEYDMLAASIATSGAAGANSVGSSTTLTLRPVPVQTLYSSKPISEFCLLPSEKRLMAVAGGSNQTVFDLVSLPSTFALVALLSSLIL